MSKVNRVTVDSNGFINRQKSKQRHKRQFEQIRSSDEEMFMNMKPKNPKSSGHDLSILGVYKEARIMKAGTKKQPLSYNNGEYKHVEDSPKLPVDHRCHPSIK